jgi:hypothetical protein
LAPASGCLLDRCKPTNDDDRSAGVTDDAGRDAASEPVAARADNNELRSTIHCELGDPATR